jgi:hypothetical protein
MNACPKQSCVRYTTPSGDAFCPQCGTALVPVPTADGAVPAVAAAYPAGLGAPPLGPPPPSVPSGGGIEPVAPLALALTAKPATWTATPTPPVPPPPGSSSLGTSELPQEQLTQAQDQLRPFTIGQRIMIVRQTETAAGTQLPVGAKGTVVKQGITNGVARLEVRILGGRGWIDATAAAPVGAKTSQPVAASAAVGIGIGIGLFVRAVFSLIVICLVLAGIGGYIWGGTNSAHLACLAHQFGNNSLKAQVACAVEH